MSGYSELGNLRRQMYFFEILRLFDGTQCYSGAYIGGHWPLGPDNIYWHKLASRIPYSFQLAFF